MKRSSVSASPYDGDDGVVADAVAVEDHARRALHRAAGGPDVYATTSQLVHPGNAGGGGHRDLYCNREHHGDGAQPLMRRGIECGAAAVREVRRFGIFEREVGLARLHRIDLRLEALGHHRLGRYVRQASVVFGRQFASDALPRPAGKRESTAPRATAREPRRPGTPRRQHGER